jgi:hypothetical protein
MGLQLNLKALKGPSQVSDFSLAHLELLGVASDLLV